MIFPSSDGPSLEIAEELGALRPLSSFGESIDPAAYESESARILPRPWVAWVPEEELDGWLDELNGQKEVAVATPNWRLSLASGSSADRRLDPADILAFLASFGRAGAGSPDPVHIAVIDSGVSAGVVPRPLLGDHQVDFSFSGTALRAELLDTYGHGSLVAALIHWLAPAARISSIRCFRGRTATLADIVYALLYLRLLAWPVHLVNLSFSVDATVEVCECGRQTARSANSHAQLAMLFAELARVLDPCPIFVAAAGTKKGLATPARLPETIAVAAAAGLDPVKPERSYDPGEDFVLAPGGSKEDPILSADRGSYGSSFATAVLTGILAQDRSALEAVLFARDRPSALQGLVGPHLDASFAGYDPHSHGRGLIR